MPTLSVPDSAAAGAAKGAKVSLLYYESDPLGLKKTPRVREQQIERLERARARRDAGAVAKALAA